MYIKRTTEKRKTKSGWQICFFVFLLAFFILQPGGFPFSVKSGNLDAHSWEQTPSQAFHRPAFKENRPIPDVILVPENKGWLISILLPYFSPDSNWSKLPDIFVVPETPSETCDRFLSSFKDRRILSFINPVRLEKDYRLRFSRLNYFSISDFPLKAALQLANAFTDRIPAVVVTSMKEPERFLRAAVFAGHYGLPLIPFQNIFKHDELNRLIAEKKVQNAYLVTDMNTQTEMFDIGFPVISLTIDQVLHYTIEKIGAKNVRNVIATRPMVTYQMARLLDSDMIHFVPYISLLRNAPLVLLNSKEGLKNEKTLTTFIDQYHIRPRTLTIVGDYHLIAPIDLEDDLAEQIYSHKHTLSRELLSRPEGDNAFPYGVGRLPFSRLPCISMYYARLAKLRLLRASRRPSFTMIANLDSDKRARLMLAESISRSTVMEFRNFHLKGSEHYGKSPSDARIWKEALKSDLLIYEGHIEQFSLVEKTGTVADPYKGFKAPLFSHFPFVALQSCHSLENAELLLNKGVSGIIGSCSKIHSASGSAFIKAYFDAILYENVNTGEALRDAKNYALSLVKLKCARGHLEHDKTMRVALSFRLVGDPEVELFAGQLQPPQNHRVSAQFIDQRTIEISTPSTYYPLVETKGYQIKLFPGAEAAGIVSRMKNGPTIVRKIHPLFFFRLDIPPNRSDKKFEFGDCRKNTARTISLIDPFNRWIYVMHYPRTVTENKTITLKFK